MKSTKFLAALLAVMMIFGTFAASAAGFTDLTFAENPEAYKNTLLLSEMGVIKGDENGNANLDKPVTRAEMAAFIFRLGTSHTDIVGGVNTTTFEDLDPNGWYVSNVVWCYEQGIIGGRDAKTFDPSADVSYDEAIKMVVTLLGYKGLSYPLGYYLKFSRILKDDFSKTLSDVLPNYKGDVAGTRYPISRGEVISLLNVALDAPLADEKGNAMYNNDETPVCLLSTVWDGNAIDSYEALVVATPTKALPGFSVAAKDKISVILAPKDSKKNLIVPTGSETIVTIANTAAAFGLATDKELLGTYFTYYTITENGKPVILKELTTAVAASVYEDIAVSYRRYDINSTASNKADDNLYLTFEGFAETLITEKGATKSALNEFTVTYDSAADVPEFVTKCGDGNELYAELEAGKEVYVVAYDLYSDGKLDWFAYTDSVVGVYGKLTKTSKDNDSTILHTFKENQIDALNDVKFSTFTSICDPYTYLNTMIDNNASAVQGNVIVMHKIGGKVVIDQVLTPFEGTVTKVVDGTLFNVKKADGSVVSLVVGKSDAHELSNMSVCKLHEVRSLLTVSTKTNFLVYNNRIIAVFGGETTYTYGGTSVAIFYGLAARDVTFTANYTQDPDTGSYVLTYTPSYVYNAYVAYDNAPASIVKIPVYSIDDQTDLSGYFAGVFTGSIGSTAKEAPADKAATATINNIATDGTAMVTVKKSSATSTSDATYGKYAISTDIAASFKADGVTSTTKEVIVNGAYVAQNALTGYYELYNESNEVVLTFRCDDSTIIMNLAAAGDVTKVGKGKIDAESGKVISYRASLANSFGAIAKKDAYKVVSDLVFEMPKDAAKVNATTTYLRRAIALKGEFAAAGQVIAASVDTAKAPYNYMILNSIDSIELDGLTATATFTLYSPVLGTTLTDKISVTGTSAADAMTKINAAIGAQLDGKVGDFFSYDATNKVWVAADIAATATANDVEFVATSDAKNLVISGHAFTAKAAVLDNDGVNYYIGAEIDGVTRYFKITETTNVFTYGAIATADVYDSVEIKKVAVETSKGAYDLAAKDVTFFVDAAFNVVFAYVG